MSHLLRINIIAAALTWLNFGLLAQDVVPTKGKEFWVGFMQNYANEPAQESLDVFITSDQNTAGILEIPAVGWSANFTVNANTTTTVTIPNEIAEHYASEVVEQKGVFISTLDTVSVFAINFNSFSADGSKVLPTAALGSDYRISSYPGQFYSSEFLIVATADGTEVEITPSANTQGGHPAGEPFTVQLDRGESYQVKAASGTGDFTGTRIKATEASGLCRPFAVFSGTGCANVFSSCGACDHTFDQNFPVNTWGSEFLVVPFSFANGYTYRVLAHEDNTLFSVNNGALVGLSAGQFAEYNNITTAQYISANKGISVIQYMQGITCSLAGDPAMMILNDINQRIDQVTFSTVDSDIITEHGLNIVVPTNGSGSVELDGVLLQSSLFSSFPAAPGFSFAQITIATGSHTLQSPDGITAYVYGTGEAESYAYSAGSFSQLANSQVVTSVCTSNEVTLQADATWTNVTWTIAGTDSILAEGNSFTLSPPIITNGYIAQGLDATSGCLNDEFFLVESAEPLAVSIVASDVSICKYESISIEATVSPYSEFYTYQWTPVSCVQNTSLESTFATPLSSTTLNVVVTTPGGCSSGEAEIFIEVGDGQISTFDLRADNTFVCAGESLDLTAYKELVLQDDFFESTTNSSLWSGISNGSLNTNCGSVDGQALYFNGAGSRMATTQPFDLTNGGSVRFSIVIGSGAIPCADASAGEDVVLEYALNGSGPWVQLMLLEESHYLSWTDVTIPLPDAALSSQTRFRWRQLSNSGANADNWALDNVCISAANTSGAYTWSNSGATTYAIEVAPVAATLYTVSYTDPLYGCMYTDTLTIDVGTPIELSLPANLMVCDAEGVLLDATVSGPDTYTYVWTTTNTTIPTPFQPEINFAPTVNDVLGLEISSDLGCNYETEINVAVPATYDLTISPASATICEGAELPIQASFSGDLTGVTLEWNHPSTLSSATVLNPVASPTSSVEYELVLTLPGGCAVTETLEVEVTSGFTIDAGEDQSVCLFDGTLTAIASTEDPLNWTWYPSELFIDANLQEAQLAQESEGTFIVEAIDLSGCVARDTLVVHLLTTPFDLGEPFDLCMGEAATLVAPQEASWSNGQSGTSIQITTGGIYTATITYDNGCERSASIEVNTLQSPGLNLGPDLTGCDGSTILLDATCNAVAYQWNTGGTSSTLEVLAIGAYSVTATGANGCEQTDVVEVEFQPAPQFEFQDTYTICDGEPVVLESGLTGVVYNWSTGSTSASISVDTPGVYSLEVTNAFGCTHFDATDIVTGVSPQVDLGPNDIACDGEAIELNAAADGDSWLWSTGETSPSIEITTGGSYSVIVSSGGCSSEDAITYTFLPAPQNTLVADTTACFELPPYEISLSAETPGALYLWDDGTTGPERTVNATGVYSVEITNGFGCSATFQCRVFEFCSGYTLYVPNAITPNNDGVNDVFKAVGSHIADFEMVIWDRWGMKVFETTNIYEGWTGNVSEGNHYVPSDVFGYHIRYRYIEEDSGTLSSWQDINGQVTVIR